MEEIPGTKLFCWACGEYVPVRYGGGLCPECGSRLVPAAYDKAARVTAEQIDHEAHELKTLTGKLKEARNKNARWGFLRNLAFLPSVHAIKRFESEKNDACARRDALLERQEKLAHSRYYSSAWFRATGMCLRSDVGHGSVRDSNPFAAAHYVNHGEFKLETTTATKERRGLLGEYVAYDLLSSAIDAGCFGHARLLRNLYVPAGRGARAGKYETEFTEEIDLLMVTQKSVYVIEVKNLNAPVTVRRARGDKVEVLVGKPRSDGSESFCRDDAGPHQNTWHIRALTKRESDRIIASELVGITMYVDNRGFSVLVDQGSNGMYFATNTPGDYCLPDLIARLETNRPVVRTEEGVEALVRHLDMAYSDADGSKAKEHVRAIEIRHRSPQYAGPKRPKTKQGKRDRELEQMMSRAFSQE